MSAVKEDALPDLALLRRYQHDLDGPAEHAHTDCFAADVARSVTLAEYVTAFYTTGLFKLERVMLKLAAKKPSTDEDVAALANGSINEFAAWTVEDRCADQLLMCDFRGRTRSWFMVQSSSPTVTSATRLFFGSAVIPVRNRSSGELELGRGYSMLLGFHKLYSVALLRAAATRLEKSRA